MSRSALISRLLAGLPLSVVSVATLAAEPAKGGLGSEPIGSGYVLQLLLGLIVVLAGVFALAWVLKRMHGFQSPAGGALRVLGGISVGQRERVLLIQVGETQLLIGVAPGSVQRIHELAEPIVMSRAPAQAGGKSAEGFAAKLSAALRQGRGG